MNWEAIGAAGELVSAIVVVVSVAYLAHQIRQNTIASRAETFRTLSIEFSRRFAGWGQDKEVSGHLYKIFYEGSVRADFKPEETQAISFSLIAPIALYDAAY